MKRISYLAIRGSRSYLSVIPKGEPSSSFGRMTSIARTRVCISAKLETELSSVERRERERERELGAIRGSNGRLQILSLKMRFTMQKLGETNLHGGKAGQCS